MTPSQLQEWIGSDPHVWLGGCLKAVRQNSSIDSTRDGNRLTTVYACPEGRLELVQQYDPPTQTWHPIRFPVGTVADIRLLTRIEEDVTYELDDALLEKSRAHVAALGESAFPAATIGTTPFMDWIEHLAGVEGAHYLLADHPAEVEALLAAGRRNLLRKADLILAHSPADAFYLVENTSTTLHSPEQFRRYAAPLLTEVAAKAKAAGKSLILHMCGHLKAILPDLARVGARGFEAFTAPPLGNTTLLDGRTACPDVCLIGGTHAMLWTQPLKTILAELEKSLAALPHHRGLVITSAGVMPPLCPPAVIRDVCRWIHAFPLQN